MAEEIDWSVWGPAGVVVVVTYLVIDFLLSGEVSVVDALGVGFGFGLGLVLLALYRRWRGRDA